MPIPVAEDIAGRVRPLAPVLAELERRFPGAVVQASSAFPRWPMEAFSNALLLNLADGRRWFLKGTPRVRPEAEVTALLHELAPDHIPEVLVEDLRPDDSWRWFVMADAGEPVVNNSLDFDNVATAFEAGRALALIQRRAIGDERLRHVLPKCEAIRLQEACLDACSWFGRRDAAHQEQFAEVGAALSEATRYFGRLAEGLSRVPSTCVHGDLWAGNIVRAGGSIRLVDWGDTLWGPGGLSVVALLAQHAESLAPVASEVWSAYACEMGLREWRGYAQACADAYDVADVVIHMQIDRCCSGEATHVSPLLRTFGRLCDRARGQPQVL